MAASCSDVRNTDPYKDGVHVLTVLTQWPQGEYTRSGNDVVVEDMNTGSRYLSQTDSEGIVRFTLPNGLYRINLSGRDDSNVFNAAADRVVLSGADLTAVLDILISRPGSIVFKEIYCGGCLKHPQQGNYQLDQYIIFHNNDFNVQYLDGICFGYLFPYNSNTPNPWLGSGSDLPEFIPVADALWQFPGDGDDFPLQPGEDAVMCLRGAIDHAAEYPLSVNLNRPDYFVCYNPQFPNPTYHPAPGNLISQDRYLDVVYKSGQSTAVAMSLNSPAVVIFRAECEDIRSYAKENRTQVPGRTEVVIKMPYEWLLDAVEVFNGGSSSNQKRLAPSADAGYVLLSDTFLGHTLMRNVDEEASASAGYEILSDTNNSLNDFHETQIQSLHE